ncbi:MAG: class I mannose-6-phosphate isomerase [Tannerellaceae bacterium]|jgi:mannose-6-phosphate isomerase class I|nr:class I mannose-6-phosphate isomerase [Tannerellaceae bacterium]
MRKSNYDKSPATNLDGRLWKGWPAVIEELREASSVVDDDTGQHILAVEYYHGVYAGEVSAHLGQLRPALWIDMQTLLKAPSAIEAMTAPYLTDDALFGHRAFFTYTDYLDEEKVSACRRLIEKTKGLILITGHGAAEFCPSPYTLIYIDMARWEIQQRFRRKEINGLGVENKDDSPAAHYKRGYFIDWIVCDTLKKKRLPRVDYWIDTHQPEVPKMITGQTMLEGLEKTARQPFRVVPFFDPAPWGGQWMKDVCGLDRDVVNYGWCFDCVPEENSLYLRVAGELFEMPANNLLFYQSRQVLGSPVEARFGDDFPIRFDFLDTIEGGNLSLQVHPTNQYIRDTFGLYYTQDESYYLLDAGEGATVYLGLKTGVDPEEMIRALNESYKTGKPFAADRYVNQWPARKHDHYLIPAGTVHCAGAGAMVLEISATPSLFTFKLWDWGRLGLDGLPRPINIRHGSHVIQWERQTEFVQQQLVNCITPVAEGDGWKEERTGLHENEFIETRRYWFTKKVPLQTGSSVNVLNLVEGDEIRIESPARLFDPFVVHYAETFIVPACVGEYTMRPCGSSEGKGCGVIKASVRY